MMNTIGLSSRFVTNSLLALFFFSAPLLAQTSSWQWTAGPYHGTINCWVKGSGGYLYGGTPVGVFRTPIDHDAWTLVGRGLVDREITALTIDSSGALYAGTQEGVFRSRDEDGPWEIVNFGLGDTNVHALLAPSPGVLLAATDNGIYRSTDGAGSWEKTVIDSADTSVLCLGVHPSGAVYAGGVSGLMRSTDNGQHWSHIRRGFPILSLAINGRGFIAVRLEDHVAFSGNSDKTFHDSGWDQFDHEYPVSIALDESNQLFIGTVGRFEEYLTGSLERRRIVALGDSSFSALFVSTQNGIAGPVRSVFTTDKSLVFASAGHVVSSSDSGATYHNFMNGLTASRVLSLADNTQRTILAGTQFAIFHLADTASSWNTPVFPQDDRLLPILCMAADSSGLVLAGASPLPASDVTHFGLYYSNDYGLKWQGYYSWIRWYDTTNAIALNARGQFFGAVSQSLVRAPDPSGYMTLLRANSKLISIALRDTTEIYAGSVDGTIYFSPDSGTTWTSTHLAPAGRIQSLVTLSEGTVYAGTSAGFFSSSDRGSSWIQRGRGELPLNIRVLVARPGPGIFAGTPDGVYRSTDEGEHWDALNEGLTAKEIYSLCFGSDGYVYAGTSGAGVWRFPINGMIAAVAPQLVSPSDGQIFFGGPITLSWHRFDSALVYQVQSSKDSLFQHNVFLNDSTLTDTSRWSSPNDSGFVSQGEGTYYWRVRAKTTAGWSAWSEIRRYILSPCDVAEGNSTPTEFCLQQNYPNPFNPSTTIKYELPRASQVTLTVYDVLGREVSLLVSERRDAGVHEVQFDASGLASGVYFYRLLAGSYVDTKKLLLVR